MHAQDYSSIMDCSWEESIIDESSVDLDAGDYSVSVLVSPCPNQMQFSTPLAQFKTVTWNMEKMQAFSPDDDSEEDISRDPLTSTPTNTSGGSEVGDQLDAEDAADSSMASLRMSQAESARLVNRLRNSNLPKFHSLTKMHLSFLLDLPGSALDEFLNDCGSSTPGSAGGHSADKPQKRSGFFGRLKNNNKEYKNVDVGLTQREIDCLLPLINFLQLDNNIQQEGLFRKSGHIGRQRTLRDKLLQCDAAAIETELQQRVYSCHDAASVLKSMLGDLVEPVLTEKHYKAHLQVPEMTQEAKQVETLQLLFQLLPLENYFLLHCLLDLLHSVARCEGNKMTADTLGTLFAPNILVPRKMPASELQAAATNVKKTVAFMIEKAPELFKVPQALVRDIATYWHEMEEDHDSLSGSRGEEDAEVVGTPRYKRRLNNPTDIPINTTVSFADRVASQQAAAQTDTQVALAQLYAHISSMPESAKKRRLMKHFTKNNNHHTTTATPVVAAATNEKHKRSKSFGDSLKKMVGRNHRRRGSGHSVQVHSVMAPLPLSLMGSPATNSKSSLGANKAELTQYTPIIKRMSATPAAPTPVMRLFKNEMHPAALGFSPKVHIVDTKLSNYRKRKEPDSDSLFNTPTLPSPLTPFHDALMSPKCMSHLPGTGCDDDQENIENQGIVISNHALLHRDTPMRYCPNKCPMMRKKRSASPIIVTPDRRFEKPTAYVSPISRTFNKASKLVQVSDISPQQSDSIGKINSQVNVMTPGSRAPLAMLQTP